MNPIPATAQRILSAPMAGAGGGEPEPVVARELNSQPSKTAVDACRLSPPDSLQAYTPGPAVPCVLSGLTSAGALT